MALRPDHPCIILVIPGSGSGKANVLLNLIKHQRPDIELFVNTSNIHSNEDINCFLMEEKSRKWNTEKFKWKFGRLKSNKEKESVKSVWWYDSRYEI